MIDVAFLSAFRAIHPAHRIILTDSQRLRCRRPMLSDFWVMQAIFKDPEMMRYLGRVHDDERLRRVLQAWIADWDAGASACGIVELKTSGEVVGTASIHPTMIPGEHGAEISYVTLKKHQRNGYALEMARALVDYAFDFLRTNRLLIDIHPDNTGSNSIAETLGFVSTGVLDYEHVGLPGHDRHRIWVLDKSRRR